MVPSCIDLSVPVLIPYYKQAKFIRTTLITRRMRWVGHVARMGQTRTAYRLLVGKPETKRPLGRPRCRWADNIKMHLIETG
jgi:hypothetical protein